MAHATETKNVPKLVPWLKQKISDFSYRVSPGKKTGCLPDVKGYKKQLEGLNNGLLLLKCTLLHKRGKKTTMLATQKNTRFYAF